MVDIGFNQKEYGAYLGEKFGVENWHSPREVLAEAGVRPEDVDLIENNNVCRAKIKSVEERGGRIRAKTK